MVRLGRILRDYREAGAINSLIALWGFVDDATFLTKSGHVGVVYQLRGQDAEGLTHAQRRRSSTSSRRPSDCWTSTVASTSTSSSRPSSRSLRRLPARGRTRGALTRRTRLPERAPARTVSTIDHFLVLLYEAADPGSDHDPWVARGALLGDALRNWLSTTATCHAARERDLDRAIGTLHHKASARRGPTRRLRAPTPREGPRPSGSSAGWSTTTRRRWPPRRWPTTRIWTTSSRTPPSSAIATSWSSGGTR